MRLRDFSFLKRALPCLLLVTSMVLASSIALSQAINGDISGSVVDPTGRVITNAKVVATRVDTNQSFNTTSNASGEFHFTDLPIGNYNLNVSAPGFKATILKNFPVELNKTASAHVQLQVGEVSTTVEVASVAPTIDTTTAQVSTTYDLRLNEVANVGNSVSGVLNLSLLQAGVGSSGGIGAGAGPSIGGQRPRNNNFTIDGVDNNDKSITGPSLIVPNDAIEEFSVLQNQFSPEFGHSNGGQFNQVIKTGSNKFHGLAYEYLENRNLNSIDTSVALQTPAGVTPKNPRFDNNRFGGQIGGPIIKNKAFFFVNYEYNAVGQALTPGAPVRTPTAAGYATLATIPGVSATNLGVFQKFVPAAPTADPSAAGTQLVNGVPVQLGILPLAPSSYVNTKKLVVSGDWDIAENDRLVVRDLYRQRSGTDTAAQLGVFYTNLPVTDHFATIGEFHTFSPRVLNEFRLGFHRNASFTTTGNFSFPGLDQFPNLLITSMNLQVGPDPNGPQFGINNTYQAIDNFSWTKGTHGLKFGAEIRKYISPQQFTQRSRGDYDYKSLALYMTDQSPDVLGERSTGNSNYYGNQIGFYWYANDNWAIRRNLTLNLGVRYEYTTVPFTERLQTLNQIANVPGVLTFNEPHYPKNAFAPRVGFAYTPGSSGKTSIRGGISMGYDVLYDNIGILSLPPEFGSTTDIPSLVLHTPNFLASGGIPPGGTGLTTFATAAQAQAATSNHIVEDIKLPTSIQWTLGVQRNFANVYSLEIRYLGTHAYHLNVQERINKFPLVTSTENLPTFLTAPSQATLDASSTTLTSILNSNGISGNTIPAFFNAGFTKPIVQFSPLGSSIYHGLAIQLNRRFANGLLLQGAYTFSKNIDNSTADFFSTVVTPRRPQDFQNLGADRSDSALDHRNRFTLAAVYDTPWFKHSNWFLKNLIGNFQVSPVYSYETGEWGDVQSVTDSNLNGDSAGDRAIFNASGTSGVGSDITPLCTSALPADIVGGCQVGAVNVSKTHHANDFIVGYVAKNGSAQYIVAGPGTSANAGRNSLKLPAINNVDLSVTKHFTFTERIGFDFGAQVQNFFNHPQYVAGALNDVRSAGNTSNGALNFLNPASSAFLNPKLAFPSNARTIGLVAKIRF